MGGHDVTIIGAGWSVRNVDLSKLAGVVIAVNDSAIYAPRWDFAVSMDRLWTEHRFDQLEAIIARDRAADRQLLPRREVWIRRSALQNLKHSAQLRWVRSFECDHESSEFTVSRDCLNGTNSGACALNLAWRMSPTRVFLLGFDMNRDAADVPYWYPPYPWSKPLGSTSDGKYKAWAAQFEAAARAFRQIGCEVFNVSPSSAIASFPKITPAAYRKECA